jgi:hypothetical protein
MKNNTKQAFPVSWSEEQDFYPGMSLNHYFAAKAMQSLISPTAEYLTEDDFDRIAYVAFRFADSMTKLS